MTRKLTCRERDEILLDPVTHRVADDWGIESSLTDLSGEFGKPRIETTWTLAGRRIQDIRHPSPDGAADVAPCEHYELPALAENGGNK